MSRGAFSFVAVQHPEQPGVAHEWSLDLTRDTRVLYGPGIQPRLAFHHEDREQPLLQHDGAVLAALPLQLGKGSGAKHFLTCGEDHTLVLWSDKGAIIRVFSGHTDAILGIWQLNHHTLLSLGTDKTLRLWDVATGEEKQAIETNVSSVEEVSRCQNETFFCVRERQGTRIFDGDGTEQVLLRGLSSPLQGFTRLPSGQWIITTVDHQTLWSSDGAGRHLFTNRFCPIEGWLEFTDGRLLVADEADTVLLFPSTVGKPTSLSGDPGLAAKVRTFLKSRRSGLHWMDDRPTDSDFEHRHNPFSALFIAQDELEAFEATEGALKNRTLWDFFNLPHFRSIKTALKHEISQARDLEKVLEPANTQRARDQRKGEQHSALSVCSTLLVLIIGTVLYNHPQKWLGAIAIGGGVLILLLLRYAWVHHRRARAACDAMAVMAVFPALIDDTIQSIKIYREAVLRQARYRHSRPACSATTVTEAMDRVVTQTLEPMALRECGLKRDDVIFPNNEAITLRGWSLLQNKTDTVAAKINAHNERSFRWANGQFVFAVQFIQFIFLTQDKLDVFSLYYDFIADKAYGREAHAFYYKDVTNILKRDVDRTDSGRTFEATEIEMAVSSGQRIALTILNQQSISALNTLGNQGDNLSLQDEMAALRAELAEIESDDTLDAATKQEEIVWVKRQLRDLETQPDEQESARHLSKADEAIENIRTQIRVHKQVAPMA